MPLNKLLVRQIQKYTAGMENIPVEFHSLFEAISESYNHYERDHNLLERAIDLSSGEMISLNDELRGESEKVKLAHKELKTLFENIEEVFFSVDMKSFKLTQMSDGCKKIYGYSADDFFTQTMLWQNVIHPEDKHISFQQLEELKTGKKVFNQYRIIHKNGSERWIENKVIPTLDKNGALIRLDGITHDITATKYAELLRLESENKYRLVFENPFFGVAMGTLEGHVTNANKKFCEILGYSFEEITDMHFSAFTHPADVEKENFLIQKMITGEIDNCRIEKRYITKSSDVIWVELNLSCVRHEIDHKQFVLAVIQDITTRKLAEKSLLESQANLSNILENTETAYVLLDKNARVLSFNKIAQQMAGAEMGKIIQKDQSYFDLMPDHKKDNIKKTIENIIKTGKEIKYEATYLQINGKARWYYISMHPIFGNDKKILGLSVAATNITERKKREVQIKQSNERYQLVTKATKDIIWDLNILDNKIYRSDNFAKVFGYSNHDKNTTNESWVKNIHEDDRQRVLLSIDEKINDPCATLWECQYRHYRTSGEIAHVEDRGYIVRDRENNKALRMVGAMRDVTEEKKLSIERDKITFDLVQRNKDLEQFAYIISHNLRLPVTNIMGLVNLIQKRSVLSEKDYQRCLNGLLTSTEKLDNIIRDLHGILQLRQITHKEKKVPVHFSELVNDIQTSIDDLLKKENVVIKMDFDVDHIYTLKSYIYSIFFNLISNSIKYRNGHDPLIEIKSQKINDKVMLTFKDNGRGIDLNIQGNKIFGLYNKFHMEVEGKGVGLYMTKTQVEILGGTINVKSAVNVGTEFTIELNN
jgi:PAS domain S-box-containing protein